MGRNEKVPASAAPGFPPMASIHECRACAHRRELRVQQDAARNDRTSLVCGVCTVCGRMVRARHVAARVLPGSAPAGAKGMCQSCYKRSRRPARAQRQVAMSA